MRNDGSADDFVRQVDIKSALIPDGQQELQTSAYVRLLTVLSAREAGQGLPW